MTFVHLILTQVLKTYFGVGVVILFLHFLYMSVVEHSKQHRVVLAVLFFVFDCD